MNISPHVNYRNFGFIPGNGLLRDLYGKLFGYRNLYKRLQARDMMRVLDVQPDETVLDIGCGRGYITIEIAKQAKSAFGVDVDKVITEITVPDLLKKKLKYVLINPGEPLPFDDNAVDKVFASEVIAAVAQPDQFLGELRRVLRPEGKLVFCNGCGHPAIKSAYERPNWVFQYLRKRHAERFPNTYEAYCVILNRSSGNQIDRFYNKEDLKAMLTRNGFESGNISHSPGLIPGRYLSWMQFMLYVGKGKVLSQKNFLMKHFILSTIQRLDKRKYEGGILYEAINKK
ncbi:methyltransferase domain-containing protein [Flavobacteriales bacterium AH-315-E23]|nr:methyltransferase domain-containing protein [Flavobacteriales bacterium AH-315-E23]